MGLFGTVGALYLADQVVNKPKRRKAELKRYTYTWTTQRSKRFRYDGVVYGSSWEDAKKNIKRYHPERKYIKRTN